MVTIDAGEMARQQTYLDQISQCLATFRQETGFVRKYWIHTYGCQLNENDGEKIAGLLDEMGYQPTEESREADLVILNTCSIRENANDRLFGNLGMIKNLRRDRPDLIVAVCGCMMKEEDHVARISRSFSFVDLVFGPQDIYRLPELLYHRLIDEKKQYYVGTEDLVVEGLPIHRARKFRALTSIMFGCNNFCTYCIVPHTRGRERSRRPEDILGELQQLAREGFREMMLLGQNVNSYGKDLAAGSADHEAGQEVRPEVNREEPERDGQVMDFADLLHAAAQIEGLYRIRFMTSHPKDISPKLLQVIAANANIERHLHLPLQSGSNRILEQMNRHYTREHYLDIVSQARSLIPGLSLSTDIIVGFPGETDEDFADTLDVLEQVRFDSAFTFQFSKRTGTPAATMTGQVDKTVVTERFTRLVALLNEHARTAHERLVGTVVEVLIEGSSDTAGDILTGRASQNQLINFSVPDELPLPEALRQTDGKVIGHMLEGSLAQVRIIRAKTFSLEGIMEDWRP